MAGVEKNWMALGIGGAVVLGAVALGYSLGRSGGEPPPRPEVGAVEATPAGADGGSLVAGRALEQVGQEAPAQAAEVPAAAAASSARIDAAPASRRRPAPPPSTAAPTEPVVESAGGGGPAAAETELADDDERVGEEGDAGEVAAPAPRIESVSVPAGKALRIRLIDAVSSRSAAVDDPVTGELAEALVVGGRTLLDAGARVRGRVVEARPLAKVGGQARLAIDFERLVADLETVRIDAGWAAVGKSETGKDAATIAAGAAAGAVLGNQAKNRGRGRILGGLIGAGIGAAVASKTPGEEIDLPAGTLLEVELAAPIEVRIEID